MLAGLPAKAKGCTGTCLLETLGQRSQTSFSAARLPRASSILTCRGI